MIEFILKRLDSVGILTTAALSIFAYKLCEADKKGWKNNQ